MAEKEMPKVKVKLIQPHTHAGKPYGRGAEIEVLPDQVAWLAALGVIEKKEA